MTRILVCDDAPEIRKYLCQEIGRDPDLTVVGEATNGRDAVEMVSSHEPDIVILDIAMPVMDGLAAIPLIRRARPSIKVVVLSSYGEQHLDVDAKLDADAFIQKGASLRSIVDLVRSVAGLPVSMPPEELTREKERNLFALSRDLLCVVNQEGYFEHLSPSWEEHLGWTIDELKTQPFLDFIHPDDRQSSIDILARTPYEEISGFENRYRCRDGSYRLLLWSSRPGNDGLVYGSAKDITVERAADDQFKVMERHLRESEELFRGAFDAARTGISLIGPDGLSYVDVNQAFCDMLGYTKDEIMSMDWLQLTHPDDRERNLEEVDDLASGRDDVKYVSKRYVRKNGEIIFVEISDSLVRSADGSPMYFVTHATDVTERERLQAQLRQAQKMEAVGQLAGGIAHDFNNILAVIMNYADFVIEDLDPADPCRSDVQEIVKAGDRAAQLVRQLLAFSRKEVVEPRVIDLNTVVEELQGLLHRSLGEDVELVLEVTEDLPHIKADPGMIEQVLLNLAVNGRDAMLDGGTLTVTTGTEMVSEGERSGLPPGHYVRMSVTDTGEGIDPATVERIFEPFFTTKARGEGTGLGLATVYGIVKQANGGVYVDSMPGAGSTFSVYLPPCNAEASAHPPAISSGGRGGDECILLVEDEAAVRDMVTRLLVQNGYQVAAFGSGKDALSFYEDHSSEVDLLITDVVMPKMSGRTLSLRSTEIDPRLKTLFMSGYTDELIAQRGMLTDGERLIKKPFNARQLLDRVRAILDGKEAA